jgi:transmembrane sensor
MAMTVEQPPRPDPLLAENGKAADSPFAALAPLERESYEFLFRFVSGTAQPADLRALEEWSAQNPARRDAFARAYRAWGALAAASALGAKPRAGSNSRSNSHLVTRRMAIAGGLAASAAGIALAVRPPLGLWPSWAELNADIRTSAGEQRRLALGEHASVTLNTRTSVAIQPSPQQAGRIELVSGEAEVTVKRSDGRPIEVAAADGRVSASDAVFNIRRRRTDHVSVTCLSGDILVECGARRAALHADQQVEYAPGQLGDVAPADAAAVSAWRDGVIVFHATPVADVIEELNRYRPGRIILANSALGQRLFSARFRIENVEAAIIQLEQVFNARATRLPGGVIVLS